MHAGDGLDALEFDGVAAGKCIAWRPAGHQRHAGLDLGAGLQLSGPPHQQAELLLSHREYLLASLSFLLKPVCVKDG